MSGRPARDPEPVTECSAARDGVPEAVAIDPEGGRLQLGDFGLGKVLPPAQSVVRFAVRHDFPWFFDCSIFEARGDQLQCGFVHRIRVPCEGIRDLSG